ncbi:MAG: PD40 domain-containing protein [Methanosarcinaceae archaeon]|nr:PD40 domain-containing protein [Methanosarcinaceae archaeon]
MKSTICFALITMGILLVVIVFLLLVIFPVDRLEANPNFPQLKGPYLGQKPPGTTPKRFAPNIIVSEVHTATVFSQDGQEVYWRPMSEEVDEILYMRLEDGIWTYPQVVTFASRFFDSDDPCPSPDGKKLFFTSWRPERWYQMFGTTEGIWFVERTENGWSNPKSVGKPINSMNLHWQLSVSQTGSLYFSSEGDIYRSMFENEQYQEPVKLANEINSLFDEGHPYIAPDESYLIFSSNNHLNSLGDYDLYISILTKDGAWSKPINLGAGVNSYYQDLYPVVSPDEEYLFFISNRDGMHSVYWVDFERIKKLISEFTE